MLALGARAMVRKLRKKADTEDAGDPCVITWAAVGRRIEELQNMDEDLQEQLNTIDSEEGMAGRRSTEELLGTLQAENEKIDDLLDMLERHRKCVSGG